MVTRPTSMRPIVKIEDIMRMGGTCHLRAKNYVMKQIRKKGKDKGRTLIYEDPKNWLRFTGPPGDQLICSKKETNKVSGSAGGREETYGPVPPPAPPVRNQMAPRIQKAKTKF